MSFCVPDYEVERPNEDDDDNNHNIFDSRRKKPLWHGRREGDDLVELLWQNGQVVMQSQNQRSTKKPYLSKMQQQQKDLDAQASEDLFIQEDEMAAWLHYPIDYESFDTDFLPSTFAPSSSRISQVSQIQEDRRTTDHEKQQIPATARKPALSSSKLEKPMQVSRTKAGVESTMVDSSETPAGLVAPPAFCGDAAAAEEEQAREVVTCDVTVTSSSGGSEEPSAKVQATDDRKRKGREVEDDDCHSEDVGLDSADTTKHVRVSTSARRSRAAEVHNLSERRRRDRINEKMKALQELIPRCNKSDKASMLDEAIEYLKSLQLQVQMMSMASCMLPMGFPGVQQYMSPMLMRMGMGMGMGMGMDAGLSHPILPFPSVLAGSSMTAPAAVTTHLGPRLSMPAFHIPPLSSTDLPTTQAASQLDTTLNSIPAQNPSLLQVPNFNDRYQHYLGLHHMQVPPCPPRMTVPYQGPVGSENPATAQQNTSKGVNNLEDNKSR